MKTRQFYLMGQTLRITVANSWGQPAGSRNWRFCFLGNHRYFVARLPFVSIIRNVNGVDFDKAVAK